MAFQTITFVAVKIRRNDGSNFAIINNAKSCGLNSYRKRPNMYFKIGKLQAPQNKFYINANNEICRELYGKEVVYTTISERFKEWLAE